MDGKRVLNSEEVQGVVRKKHPMVRGALCPPSPRTGLCPYHSSFSLLWVHFFPCITTRAPRFETSLSVPASGHSSHRRRWFPLKFISVWSGHFSVLSLSLSLARSKKGKVKKSARVNRQKTLLEQHNPAVRLWAKQEKQIRKPNAAIRSDPRVAAEVRHASMLKRKRWMATVAGLIKGGKVVPGREEELKKRYVCICAEEKNTFTLSFQVSLSWHQKVHFVR